MTFVKEIKLKEYVDIVCLPLSDVYNIINKKSIITIIVEGCVINRNILGKTGMEVSELCFGTLPMGPLQADIPLKEGIQLLLSAMDSGINFFDTAQLYRTYPYLRKAMNQYGKKNDLIIATKSTALDYDGMEMAIQEALTELDREYIDIFHLHVARYGLEVFDLTKGALECLIDYKQKGYIRAIGIATHDVAVTAEAADKCEYDVIFPIMNIKGMGIQGGARDDMIKSIAKVKESGKGLYLMKSLAGGNLISDLENSINFVRNIEGSQAIALGMINLGELELNLKIFNDEKIDSESINKTTANKRITILKSLCKACGRCVEFCPNHAVSIVNDIAAVDIEKCLLCGYCTPECPEFAIRVR